MSIWPCVNLVLFVVGMTNAVTQFKHHHHDSAMWWAIFGVWSFFACSKGFTEEDIKDLQKRIERLEENK